MHCILCPTQDVLMDLLIKKKKITSFIKKYTKWGSVGHLYLFFFLNLLLKKQRSSAPGYRLLTSTTQISKRNVC